MDLMSTADGSQFRQCHSVGREATDKTTAFARLAFDKQVGGVSFEYMLYDREPQANTAILAIPSRVRPVEAFR